MVEGTGGAGLTPEAGQPYGIPSTLRGQELQGDGPVEAVLPGLVDHTHAAAAEQPQNLEAGDLGRGLLPRARRTGWRVSASDRRSADLFRQLRAVLREALEVVMESEAGL